MSHLIFAILIFAAIYSMFRYYKLLFCIRAVCKELTEARQDLSQNQMVYLPMPERHLGRLINCINAMLEGIQRERQAYEWREKNFQKQIENISHDLRTPLTVILGYLKLFKKEFSLSQEGEGISPDEFREALTVIERKAETMNTLVAQFYDYSRLRADDYRLRLKSVDVSRILREAVLANHHLLAQKGLEVALNLPEYPNFVLGDQAALERIFQNLFQNAVRYADSTLKISIREDTDTAVVSFVNDTSVLSEADIPFLFDRFYMQNAARNQGGTGLGLTIAKALAEEMQGTLRASASDASAPDGRMEICFELALKSLHSTSISE